MTSLKELCSQKGVKKESSFYDSKNITTSESQI